MGLTLDEAVAWVAPNPDVFSSDQILACLTAGLDAETVTPWVTACRSLAADGDQIAGWLRHGFDVAASAPWREQCISPDAASLLARDWTAEQVQCWKNLLWAEARQVHEAGLYPDEEIALIARIDAWTRRGLTFDHVQQLDAETKDFRRRQTRDALPGVGTLLDDGAITIDEAVLLLRSGLDHESVAALAGFGVSVADAARWLTLPGGRSIKPYEIGRWAAAGLTAADAAPWLAVSPRFASYEKVAAWIAAGLTAADAEPWVKAAEQQSFGRVDLTSYEEVCRWQAAHPKLADPTRVGRLLALPGFGSMDVDTAVAIIDAVGD